MRLQRYEILVDCGCFFAFFFGYPAAMSCQRRRVRERASMAAVYPSFPLDGKSRIRRSQRTEESRPTSTACRTRRTPLRHVGRDPRAQPGEGWAFPLLEGFTRLSLIVIAGLPPFKGVPEGRGIKDPQSPKRQAVQQACHADVGLCGGGHLCLRAFPRPHSLKTRWFQLAGSARTRKPVCRHFIQLIYFLL